MAGFQDAREFLGKALNDEVNAKSAWRQAKRAHDINLDAGLADPFRDERQAAILAKKAEAAETEFRAAEARLGLAHQEFAKFSDPRKSAEQWPDSDPLLLWPLRIETRFGTGSGGKPELWVRVYPDSALIDAFEEAFSESELEGAKRYWLERWCAGGDKDLHRAAWRQLVAAHGVGRARYILSNYAPVNEGQEPRAKGGRVVLVIPAKVPMPPVLFKLVTDYWTYMWKTGGSDAQAQQKAFETLAGEVGETEALSLLAQYQPAHFAELARQNATLELQDIVQLEYPKDPPTTASSWSSAPKADPLPDRLVLILSVGGTRRELVGEPIPKPLYVGFDPTGLVTGAPKPEGADLTFDKGTAWLADFDEAVKVGMGFRVSLQGNEPTTGFDRLYVVGLNLSLDAKGNRQALQQALQHRLYSNADLEILPQGTPTNNTEEADSGFARRSDPDQVFDVIMGNGYSDFAESTHKHDGQWLTEALSLDQNFMRKVLHADGDDQRVARAMHRALWPATLGYWMSTLLAPVFGRKLTNEVRNFLVEHVQGGGVVPSIRIGNQPYGILPITAFGNPMWVTENPEKAKQNPFLVQLYPMLMQAARFWNGFAGQVPQIGAGGDPGQTLLDILNLNPISAEFHFRFAESSKQLGNMLQLVSVPWGSLGDPEKLKQDIMKFLQQFGYAGDSVPQLAKLILRHQQGLLDGGVIASEPLQPGFEKEHKRYVRWLIDAARNSVELVRLQKGLPDDVIPHALLYIMLRHAVLLGFDDAARRLQERGEEGRHFAYEREEPLPFVASVASGPQSKWERLFDINPALTEGSNITVEQYLVKNLGGIAETEQMYDQLKALDMLAGATRGETDRAFRQHIDCLSYRLDPWQLGFVNAQLGHMKREGIYLGAYGWLHDVRPKQRNLQPADISDSDHKLLDPSEKLPPLMQDASNEGLIHAPSLDQAVTGAILRSAYAAMPTTAERNAIGVNLSSERVRDALALMDGMRMGQSLNALLGYRFERNLHDRYAEAETDEIILDLRQAFPLVSDNLKDTATQAGDEGRVAARNVVDGLKLIEHMRKTGKRNYPFDLTLPPADEKQRAVIDSAAAQIENLHDGLGDLALSESVHQSVKGNYDRAAATLDAFSKGMAAPEPEVVLTPTTGISLTHRVCVHVDPAAEAPASATPRALCEPQLNVWIATRIPPLEKIGCSMTWFDPANNSAQSIDIRLSDLGLQPIDLLYLWQSEESDRGFSALKSMLVEHAITQMPGSLRCDAKVMIEFKSAPDGCISVFEAAALLGPLSSLLKSARRLRPTDLLLESRATLSLASSLVLDTSGLQAAHAVLVDLPEVLKKLRDDCNTAMQADAVLVAAGGTAIQSVALFSSAITRCCTIFLKAGLFGLEQARPDRLRDMELRHFTSIMKLARDLNVEWSGRLTSCDASLAQLAGLADDQRERILKDADLALPAATPATGADSFALEATIRARRASFAMLVSGLGTLLATHDRSISAALAALESILANSQFKTTNVSSKKLCGEIMTGVSEIAAAAETVRLLIERRIASMQEAMSGAFGEANLQIASDLHSVAAAALFGDGFLHLDKVVLSDANLTEFLNATTAAQSGSTLKFLRGALDIDLPVAEWLYGIARVREPLQNLESSMQMGEAFGIAAPDLIPVQLPPRMDDSWLGLSFPPDYDIDGSKLLYTAEMTAPIGSDGVVCGFVLDEWTEVIPGARREATMSEADVHTQTTGLSFHFDRPNAEAPQSMLLVTPAAWDGAWHWNDIVGALDAAWDLMRQRAVEPHNINEPAVGHLLPATFMATAPRDVTISAVLASNIGVTKFMRKTP